jgi:mannosyltransferase OCH1-like enzyme
VGAFKVDLFLVLRPFIHGGVYADVDMRLVSDLDVSVPPDTGFMVAFDNVSTTRMK